MGAQHTPGPWAASYKTKRTNNQGVYDSEGRLVASLDVHQLATPQVIKRRVADATLIAAAPKLLQACAATIAGYPGWQEMILAAYSEATGEPT